VSRAGIVLAGGASRRFGRDKLAETVDGLSLLERAVDGVRPVVSLILVVLAPGDDRVLPAGAVAIHDPVAHEGPLAGVAAGLTALDGLHAGLDQVIVVGGDMPSVAPAVLALLLDQLRDGRVDAAWLTDGDGRERPLPLALRAPAALARCAALLAAGDRRLRALPLSLPAAAVGPASWRPLDPEGGTLRDVDVPADLGPTDRAD
jgi:molybdopterin-guanine dinucleotide biosynthesis protein A